MAKDRHRGAFVFGSIIGGAVGAVAALWKTPQSGAELRRKLGFESDVAHGLGTAARGVGSSAAGAAVAAKPLPTRALGFLEQAAAPLVGVKLGHTANHSQPGDPAGQTDVIAITDELDAAAANSGVVRRKTELVDITPSQTGPSS